MHKKPTSSATKEPQNGSQKLKLPPRQADSSKGLMRLGRPVRQLSRKEGAWRRFIKGTDLKLSDLQHFPSLAFLGQRPQVISAMRFSEDPAITEFLKIWDKTPAFDRSLIPLSFFALKAGVDVNKLVGAYVMCFRSLQAQKSAIAAMSAHPEVVASTIKFSELPDGERDRRMLHEAVGFLPTSKGMTINQNFGQTQQVDGESEADPLLATAPDVNDLFPMINKKQEDWQGNRQKLLEDTN